MNTGEVEIRSNSTVWFGHIVQMSHSLFTNHQFKGKFKQMKKQKAIGPIDFHTEPQWKERAVKFPNSMRINFSCIEEIYLLKK